MFIDHGSQQFILYNPPVPRGFLDMLAEAALNPAHILNRVTDSACAMVHTVGFREPDGTERRTFEKMFFVPDELKPAIALNLCELQRIEQCLPNGIKGIWQHYVSLVQFTCELRRDMTTDEFRSIYLREIDYLHTRLLSAFD